MSELLATISEAFATLQSLVTIIAIFGGGYWFWRRRILRPRVTLAHSIETHSFEFEGNVLLKVQLTIKNTGEVMLRIRKVRTEINQLLPTPDSAVTSFRRGLNKEGEPRSDGDELTWGYLRLDDSPKELDIEPKESDTVLYDFIIPSATGVVQVYSHVENLTRLPARKGFGWPITSTHMLRPKNPDRDFTEEDDHGI